MVVLLIVMYLNFLVYDDIFFYIWILSVFLYFLYEVVVLIVSYAFTSHCQVFELPHGWKNYYIFSTFGFFWSSCTSYNKWFYCSYRMVVLLIIKYSKFLVNDRIILFFLHFDFVSFLVLPIISGSCNEGRGEEE
jgi:hypothetical protein